MPSLSSSSATHGSWNAFIVMMPRTVAMLTTIHTTTTESEIIYPCQHSNQSAGAKNILFQEH